MVDGVILLAIVIPGLIAIFQMMFFVINSEGGTKGISKDAYYGRKTGSNTQQKKAEKIISMSIVGDKYIKNILTTDQIDELIKIYNSSEPDPYRYNE